MGRPEANLTKRIRRFLDKQHGLWYYKVHGESMQQSGLPDIIGSWNGRFIAMEIKTEKGKLSQLQEYTLNEIQSRGGGIAIVVFGWDDFIVKFNQIKEVIEK